MYYVENTRDNYTRTIGCATLKKDCKNVVNSEIERLNRKGIKKHGVFTIRNEKGERTTMHVKNSRNTYNKMEYAGAGYGCEL